MEYENNAWRRRCLKSYDATCTKAHSRFCHEMRPCGEFKEADLC